MNREYWKRQLKIIHEEIESEVSLYEYRKGLIVADDEAGTVLDFVKEQLDYDNLISSNKSHELTIDDSWPLKDIDLCWNKLVNSIDSAGVHHGLLVLNILDFKMFEQCWCLKQLAKQEKTKHIFDGYVLLVLKDITWDEVSKFSIEHNKGQFEAMMQFYRRVIL